MAERHTFEVLDLLAYSGALRTIGAGAASLEEVASAVVVDLRGHFVDKDTGQPALPLVRFYVSCRHGDLEPALQDFARAAGSDAPANPDVMCLTLLATSGEESAWNDRRASVGHKAIPLPSVQALKRLPMVAGLIEQLGLEPGHVITPDPGLVRDLTDRTCRVFYIPEAQDSPFVPDQTGFVIPYGIRSVVGFGGVLSDGSLFAVVLFSSVPVPPSTVDAFATVALSVKAAVLPHVGASLFAPAPPPWSPLDPEPVPEPAQVQAMNATLLRLVDAQAAIMEAEAQRLEERVAEAENRADDLAVSLAALTVNEARKAAIVEGALDCIVGMDSTGRITDFNQAAERVFGYERSEVIGRLLADVIIPYGMRRRHRTGLENYLSTGTGPVVGRRIEVSALLRDGSEIPVELTVIHLADTDPPQFNGYLRDITPARRAAEELVAGKERLAHIARTLQTSLLPPTLPEVDGLEFGAAFRAFGDGYEVGGDFYDAFQLSGGRWAVSLGDVCGKGSEAAVVTALARYTLRAAAMQFDDPAAVLKTLNEAIHRQHPEQFCTAVYATVDPGSGQVELALGGHPRPLLLTSAGAVTAVGNPGRLLGPFLDWEGSTHVLTLGVGDALVLYSDGVTEARVDGNFFGEDRLIEATQAAIGHAAGEAVRMVEARVLDFADHLTDDLAILAVRRRA